MATKVNVYGTVLNPNTPTQSISEILVDLQKQYMPITAPDNTTIELIPNGASSTIRIKDGGVSYNKLSDQLKLKVDMWEYNDDTTPTSINSKLAINKNMQNKDILDLNKIEYNTGNIAPAYKEGTIFYDADEHSIAFYNENSQMKVLPSREAIVRVYNNTGATISDGVVVYPNGVYLGVTTVGLANANTTNKSRIVGVTTTNIPNESYGYVCKFGEVNNIDTSMFSAGDILYLDTVDGQMRNTIPLEGAYPVIVGIVQIASLTGKIIVDISSSHSTIESKNTNGFSPAQVENTELSFDNTTRTFTVSALSYPYHFYQLGIKYEKYAEDEIQIPNEEGLYVLYYDEGVLSYIKNPTQAEKAQVIIEKTIISYVYWDADNEVSSYFAEERHGIYMSPDTHRNLHFTRGCQAVYGLGLDDIIPDGNGNNNTHAQFSCSAGAILDEDIFLNVPSVSSTTGLPIYYISGNRYLRLTTNTGYSVLTDIVAGVGSTGRLVYNQNNGGNWQLTTVSNGSYVLCHVFAINSYTPSQRFIAIIGQAQYSSATDARNAAITEISSIVLDKPEEEMVAVGTVIFQSRDNYTNAVKARIISTTEGQPYVDWRVTELSQGIAPSDHSNLTNLQTVGLGVNYGHISNNNETIYGVKTFNDGILIPPTTYSLSLGQTIIAESTSLFNTYLYFAANGNIMKCGRIDMLRNAAGDIAFVDSPTVVIGDTSTLDFSAEYSINARLYANTTITGWSIAIRGDTF